LHQFQFKKVASKGQIAPRRHAPVTAWLVLWRRIRNPTCSASKTSATRLTIIPQRSCFVGKRSMTTVCSPSGTT